MKTIPGIFLQRLNRFVAMVQLADDRQVAIHIASSGRMAEVLVPGAPVRVLLTEATPGGKTAGRMTAGGKTADRTAADDKAAGRTAAGGKTAGRTAAGRKTVGGLVMAQVNETWVSVDTSLPGRLFRQAFARGELAPFAGYKECHPEVPFGQSRLDFCLRGPDLPTCFVEVKSVTSVLPDADGVRVARFPDAPTTRGLRHLHELMHAQREGYRAAVAFMVQRGDAQACGPWEEVDPAFAAGLREAAASGVEVLAWQLLVQPEAISLGSMLPVRLG